ncbi:DUF676 domain-containing protein [Aphelenchoides besseyi]|nr:DUF676 domain-containing protein [Aphelenchoides besseyi]
MRIEAYPRFSVHLTLDEFHAIDLVHGYYQIRFRFKPNFPFTTKLTCDAKQLSSPQQSYPAVHFETGVSRPIKIAFSEQTVELFDVFRSTVDVHKRFDRFVPTDLEIQLELWYLDPESIPLPENYTFVSKRLVSLLLQPDRTIHLHRPIFFEYYAFSAVSITVHVSVTEMILTRTKSLPDPPLNEKLANYHRSIFTRLFGCYLSLQTFIKKHGTELLTSPLKIACVDVEMEIGNLQNVLASHQQPWQLLQEQVKSVCGQLTRLFLQLIQLFNCNRALSLALLDEFDQQRMKRFAEGFLFVEDTVKSLLHPVENNNGRIFALIKKSGYLNKLPNISIRVDGTDIDPNNVSLILEHRYLPTGATTFSPSDTTTGESNSQRIPRISTEITPPTEASITEAEKLLNQRSSTRNQFMCFPLKSSNKFTDDSYGSTSKNDQFLNPMAYDRWGTRRMTDPCCTIHVEDSQSTDLLQVTANNCTSNGSLKSKSFSNIVAHTANSKTDDTIPSTSDSSSTSSLTRTAVALSPQKKRHSQQSTQRKAVAQNDRVIFVEQKELLKQRLSAAGYRGYFYSDQASFINRRPYFSTVFNQAIERRNLGRVHLVVFVHGLEGTSEDLSAYRNSLRIAAPETNFAFLLSEVNQKETWSDLNTMSENLLSEILKFIQRMPQKPHRISMIAHSLGGLIVRAMLSLEGMRPLIPNLWTFLTLNSPHAGILYVHKTTNWGISFLKWWKSSVSIEQLLLKDNINIHDSFLYKLSQNGAFAHFRHVLLVGSQNDLYVPSHSALLELCKEAAKDPSAQAACYHDMLTHINESIISSPQHTTLVKYTVLHSLANVSRAHQLTGRAVFG